MRDRNPKALINNDNLCRRERLIRVLLAAWLSGADKEELVHRLRVYDERFHQPINGIVNGPHFRKERFQRAGKTPDQAAREMVEREVRSLESRYGKLAEQPVPASTLKNPPARLENGTLCIARLKHAVKKDSKRGPYWFTSCEIVGSRHRVMTSLFPDNEISRSLVRAWRQHVGRDVPEDQLMDRLDDLKGLPVGVRIRLQNAPGTFHHGRPEIGAFLSISKEYVKDENNHCKSQEPCV